jgi:hypothetical protein
VEQEGDDRGELELAEVVDQVLQCVDPPPWLGQRRSKIWNQEDEGDRRDGHREERRRRTCQADSMAESVAAIVVEVLCSPPAGDDDEVGRLEDFSCFAGSGRGLAIYCRPLSFLLHSSSSGTSCPKTARAVTEIFFNKKYFQ